jgi:hypothetical protein
VAEDERQAAVEPAAEPIYEPIGRGWTDRSEGEEDDAGWSPPPVGAAHAASLRAAEDWLRTIRTVRFWVYTVVFLLGTWLAAAAFIEVTTAGAVPPPPPAENRLWTYIVASAFMPAAGALLAVHWGLLGIRPSPDQHAAPLPEHRLLAEFLATVARGVLFAALAFILLLVQAGTAGASGAIAGASAAVIVLEFAVFGAIGAGVSAWVGRPVWAGIAGWTVAAALVAGNVGAVWVLLPAVRTEDPVSVVLNIDRGTDGSLVAYECSPVVAGTAEVFHTERIVWLAAANPVVIFVMLAADADPGGEVPDWIPATIREAADGTTVPCANAVPWTKDAAQVPLGLIGLAMQGGLAGSFLAGGQLAVRRRLRSAG